MYCLLWRRPERRSCILSYEMWSPRFHHRHPCLISDYPVAVILSKGLLTSQILSYVVLIILEKIKLLKGQTRVLLSDSSSLLDLCQLLDIVEVMNLLALAVAGINRNHEYNGFTSHSMLAGPSNVQAVFGHVRIKFQPGMWIRLSIFQCFTDQIFRKVLEYLYFWHWNVPFIKYECHTLLVMTFRDVCGQCQRDATQRRVI